MSDEQQKQREDELFKKALRLLYQWRLEELGIKADIIVTKIESEGSEE